MPVNETIAGRIKEMTEWRRKIHANPELGFEENETADFIAEKLESFGIEVHRGMAKTGVVGVIKGEGSGNRMVGLRADIDALPMTEENTFDYASKNPGKMHACGHDGHTTMLLGAAQYLAETRNFDGTVVVIFQPAEEGGGGGKVMIDDGLFEKFPVETVWGLHNFPGMEAGTAAIHRGPAMAAADVFRMKINGRGSHAAQPHHSLDPIVAGASLISAIQSIVSRKIEAQDAAVISVTQFHGGDTHNVIADYAEIEGTARYFSKDTGKLIKDTLAEMGKSIAAAHGCTCDFEWDEGYPPTINHAEEADRAAQAARDVMGDGSVTIDPPPVMGSEDFAFMLEARPGAYIALGAGGGGPGKMLHNTGYDFNDDILPIGASYWVQLAENELAPR